MAEGRSSGAELVVGRLGAPRGLRGDLRVQSYSGEYEHILRLKKVELRSPQGGAPLKLEVLRAEEGSQGLVMAFEGYTSPEAARALTGMEIVVERSGAAPLREGEWYVSDLVGLELFAGGQALAKVRSVLEGGPDPWLEAVLPDGSVHLVPFRGQFVGEIDLEKGRAELLAPWLLE